MDLREGLRFYPRDDGAGELFVHINNVDGVAESLALGQRVEFAEAINRRNNKPEATNVKLLEGP